MKTQTKKRGAVDSANESHAEPRLLCEGWLDEGCEGSCVFVPERAYVIQGTKVWMAYGSSDGVLDESSNQQIVENYDDLELEERTIGGNSVRMPKGGRWVVEGPSQRSDVKNANQRVYSRKIWEKLVGDKGSYVQEAIAERQMVGHLEHPKDGRTDLKEAAILTTKAELRKDGVVWNQFELLETPNGLILQELTRKGIKWGVSSRGTGTVADDGHVSEEDYTLKTWDAVASPSTPGAHPKLVLYGRNENTEEDAPVLSEDGERTLSTLTELTETEADGVPASVQLRRDILDALASLDEMDMQAILFRDQGWAKIHAAVERARKVSQGASIDTAIEEALADVEESEEGASLLLTIEDLQEQVSDSVTENIELRSQLEAAESERDAQTERLAGVEGELTRLRVEYDLARELLTETPGRNAGDVTAAADEAISEEPELERFRDLMESVETVEQVRNLAERLAPVVRKPAPVQVTEEPVRPTKPRRPARTALPVGLTLDETANVSRSKPVHEIAESSGARIVAKMPGFKKSS